MNRSTTTDCRLESGDARRNVAPAPVGARAVTEVVRPLHYPRTDRAVEQTPAAALAPERRSTVRSQRRLVTVVFFDLVQSTRTALQLGDRAWCDLLRRFYDEADHLVSAAEGRVVKTTGDGFLAVFDSPSDAVRAAIATRNAVNELGLTARGGIHTAEVELLGDDVIGIGVHIGARITQAADDDEVWVSRTVRDLVAGSDLKLIERGSRNLPGFDEEWELYAVGV